MSTSDLWIWSSTVTVLALLAGTSLLATAASHLCVHLKLGRGRRRRATVAPAISVLKPLKGTDEGLYENLASLAAQDYPGLFEIVLGAADPDDPALAVAWRLRRDFPDVNIRIVPGQHGPGLNPKVANLIALSRAASHPYLLISDSNVRVRPDYLRQTAAAFDDPRVGLVSNLIAGDGEQSLGATLENLHLNSFVVSGICGAEMMANHPCVIGKSMLMSREALEAVGGFAGVQNVLGEDYLLGVAFRRAGYRVALSDHAITTVNARWPMSRFLARHLRWSQMRRWIAPYAYTFEPLLNPSPWLLGLVGMAALHDGVALGLSARVWGQAALGGLVLKMASDVGMSMRLRGAAPRGAGLVWIPVKDLAVLGLWVAAWWVRGVEWRGNRLRIGPGSALEPVIHPAPRRRVFGRRGFGQAGEIVLCEPHEAVDEAA